jgi:hypothetical protein
MAAPWIDVTVLPHRRMAAAGGGILAVLVNPVYLLFSFSQIGTGQANACAAAGEVAMVMKGRADEFDAPPGTPSP